MAVGGKADGGDAGGGDANGGSAEATGMRVFSRLNVKDLRELAVQLRSGRMTATTLRAHLPRLLAEAEREETARELERLLGEGMRPAHLADVLDLLAEMRGRETKLEDRLDLVWTGPEGPGTASRDTAAVVRELFATAERHVLLSGYVVYKGLEVFEVLARRMDESPALSVRMFLNVDRPAGDTSLAVEIVKRFAADFALKQWPGTRRPEVFYDPRALSSEPGKHAVLHAKCLVVDHETALVSSANFTPAALERNIEAGVLLRSASFAARLEAHFESLVTAGVLRRLDFADASGCP